MPPKMPAADSRDQALDFEFTEPDHGRFKTVHKPTVLFIVDQGGTAIFRVDRHALPDRSISLLLALAIVKTYYRGVFST